MRSLGRGTETGGKKATNGTAQVKARKEDEEGDEGEKKAKREMEDRDLAGWWLAAGGTA